MHGLKIEGRSREGEPEGAREVDFGFSMNECSDPGLEQWSEVLSESRIELIQDTGLPMDEEDSIVAGGVVIVRGAVVKMFVKLGL